MDPARSVASALEISNLIAHRFDVKVRSCELWFAWWWDEYAVVAVDGEYRFRIPRGADPDYAEMQANAASACEAAAVRATVPAATSTGSRWTRLDFPEGPRSALLLPAELRAPGTWDDVPALGSLTAAVHNATDVVGPSAVKTWSPADLAGHDDLWLRRLYRDQDADREYMIAYREHALARAEASADTDVGFLHGEAYPASMYKTDTGGLDVGTFEYCGYGSRMYDIATLRWALELHMRPVAHELFAAYIDKYRESRPLEFSEDSLRAWVGLRHLWAFRLGWVLAAEQGLAGLMNQDTLAKRVKFARHWTL